SFIHPVINGKGDEQDWDKAGRLEIGGARGTMHRSSSVQRLWYGVDHLNFYLRVDFKSGMQPGQDIPAELHLLWFYPDQIMHNSPAPIAELPEEAPLNYLFHHHLGINLQTASTWFEEAGEHLLWHPRASRAQAAFEQCLEVAVPWADLQISPDYPIRLILVFADNGIYRSYVPENALVPITVP
ncbi:MAG TPA: glycoside hydrolase, partial [Allocoleopsis sp.]